MQFSGFKGFLGGKVCAAFHQHCFFLILEIEGGRFAFASGVTWCKGNFPMDLSRYHSVHCERKVNIVTVVSSKQESDGGNPFLIFDPYGKVGTNVSAPRSKKSLSFSLRKQTMVTWRLLLKMLESEWLINAFQEYKILIN